MTRRFLPLLAVLAVCASPAFGQIDGSGTITTGGTAQTVFPAATTQRNYLFCQSAVGNTGTMYVNAPTVAGAANGSYELAPGGSITFDSGFIPQGPVSIYHATTGARFTCKRG